MKAKGDYILIQQNGDGWIPRGRGVDPHKACLDAEGVEPHGLRRVVMIPNFGPSTTIISIKQFWTVDCELKIRNLRCLREKKQLAILH